MEQVLRDYIYLTTKARTKNEDVLTHRALPFSEPYHSVILEAQSG